MCGESSSGNIKTQDSISKKIQLVLSGEEYELEKKAEGSGCQARA